MKNTLLIALFVLVKTFAFCQDREIISTYKIEYRDTNDTYLKIYLFDSLSGEDLSGEFQQLIPVTDSPKNAGSEIKKVNKKKENLLFKINPDIYSFQIFERVLNNVDIRKNKLNSVSVYLQRGTLQFAYYNETVAPAEFEAKVTKISDPTRVTIQKCDNKFKYPFGKYYIEVNTIPPFKANIDIAEDASFEIQIQRPGLLIINSSDKTSDIRMYTIVDSEWAQIRNIDLNDATQFPLKVLSDYPLKITWKHNGRLREKEIRITVGQTLTVNCF